MTELHSSPMSATSTLMTVFSRLFENEFATLDGIAISCRGPDGLAYVDESSALGCLLLGDEAAPLVEPRATPSHALHLALHAASPDVECVISGLSRHLQALLLEGHPLPPPTSMMRKRGISDLAAHLVGADALTAPRLRATIAQAKETAAGKGMRHILLVTSEGLVVVAGAPPYEAMAHWHNVEFAARVACMAIDDAGLPSAATTAANASTATGGPITPLAG